MIFAFLTITIAEALHYFPGLGALNAFGTEHLGLQLALLAAGMTAFAVLTLLSCRKACADFEKTDL
ncbi:MAG: hypothetical protein K6G61_07695 [Solobacterium sp.]|nr:hypothetical protein [Solobacterium sp.]